MYGYIAGITDTNIINYCPKCGKEIADFDGNGMAKCRECGLYFGVVEGEEDEEH